MFILFHIAVSYLGRFMTAGDDNWMEVAANLSKSWEILTRMTSILGQEGEDSRICGWFFKAFVQAGLIFGSEMWVLNPQTEQSLGSFQHRVVRRINGRQMRRQGEGGWEYPPLASATEEAGLEDIGVYIQKRKNTVAQYIAIQPILDLCEQSVWRTGAWIYRKCWEQEVIDLGGERERTAAETDREEEKHG